jgi:hypothetical protein
MFRDAANAAWLSAMYGDLLGVTPKRSRLARCLAMQTVDFVLGKNPVGLAFQVGMGPCVLSQSLERDMIKLWLRCVKCIIDSNKGSPLAVFCGLQLLYLTTRPKRLAMLPTA